MAKTSVSNWELGINEPGTSILVKLIELSQGEVREFFLRKAGRDSGLSGAAMQEIAANSDRASAQLKGEKRAHGKFAAVRLAMGHAGAGPGYHDDRDEFEGAIHVPRDLCPNSSHTFCIRVKGSSMSPEILGGEIAAVDRSLKDIARLKGKVVAAYNDVEGVVLKRLVRVSDSWLLASDEPGHMPLRLGDGWNVIGKVIWWIRKAD